MKTCNLNEQNTHTSISDAILFLLHTLIKVVTIALPNLYLWFKSVHESLNQGKALQMELIKILNFFLKKTHYVVTLRKRGEFHKTYKPKYNILYREITI